MATMERSLSLTSHFSTLSTPDLSPQSSEFDSTDAGSYFSALSSTDSRVGESPGALVAVASPPSVDFPSLDPHSGKTSFLKATLSKEHGHRPTPLPLFDYPPSSPLPRKLQKKSQNGGGSSPVFMARPVSLLRRATGHEPFGMPKKRARRSSLPSIPSASGSFFPLVGRDPANARKVTFESMLMERDKRPHRRVVRSPYPNPNTSTNALVSLAWTGEFSASCTTSPVEPLKTSVDSNFFHSSLSIANTSLRGGWKSTWSLSGDSNDEADSPCSSIPSAAALSIVPRPRDPTKIHRRRWTLAMAITDDKITDEMLIDELERMRTVEKMWQYEDRNPGAEETRAVSPGSGKEVEPSPVVLKPSLPCLSDPALSAVWQSARRALLICREFVRTERHYLVGLRTLASGETMTAPPPLMLTYLPALVTVSQVLMQKMERNPSAQGVASAFLSVEEQLEAALVGWCGVVGGFFADAEPTMLRERSYSSSPLQNSAPSMKKRVNSWGKRINSIKALTGSNPPTPVHVHKRQGPSVRDLAILPTQRLMRYTLLFKDLFSHTPINNTSGPDVERAMKASVSIAQKCDRAQDNAAFLNKSA